MNLGQFWRVCMPQTLHQCGSLPPQQSFSFPINPKPIRTPRHSIPSTHHAISMATQRQITANRANAARSTGPTTPEGKQIAAQNSTRHGMLAQTVVLEGESQSRFEELLPSYIALIQPRSAAETALVETMTIARWKQMRIWGIEKAGFQLEMSRESAAAGANATRGYLTFKKLADNSRVLDLQHRYETGYERQFCRAYAFLLKLREKPDPRPPDTQTQDVQFTGSPFLLMPLVCATATWEPPAEAPGDDVHQAEINSAGAEAKPDEAEGNSSQMMEEVAAKKSQAETNNSQNQVDATSSRGNEKRRSTDR